MTTAEIIPNPPAIVAQRRGRMEGGELLVNTYADGTQTAQWRANDWEQWSHPEAKLTAVAM